MIIRELLERLRAADPDAEVWVGVPLPGGGMAWQPLEDVQAQVPEAVADGRTRCVLVGRERPPSGPEPLRDVAGLAEGLAQGMGGGE